jgi:hypothetical protein
VRLEGLNNNPRSHYGPGVDPVPEMSTRNISLAKARPAHEPDRLAAICEAFV